VAANVAGLPPERAALIDPALARALEEETVGLTALDYIGANATRQACGTPSADSSRATICC
jgi:hypothetical protein